MKTLKRIRVLVADDHMIVRRGIVSLLSLNSDFEVLGEAVDGRSAIDMTLAKKPDVVLMDINMPDVNGLEATRRIKGESPHVKVLALSAYDNPEYVVQILQSGANGYLLKTTSPDDLYAAIKAVHSGQAFFSPSISKIVLDSYLNKATEASGHPDGAISTPLTPREVEILRLIVAGKSHQQIASVLHISARTVDTHRNNIMKKLDLHDTASLVTYAIRNRIVDLS